MDYTLIEKKMRAWRRGLTGFPAVYLNYHKALALEAANALVTEGFTIHRTGFESAGDCDGMWCVTLIVERHRKLAKLKWHDELQRGEWFIQCESGGYARFELKSRLCW